MGGSSGKFSNVSKFSKSIFGGKSLNSCVNKVGLGFKGSMVIM